MKVLLYLVNMKRVNSSQLFCDADGSFRLIVNLKRLNEHIVYHHLRWDLLNL